MLISIWLVSTGLVEVVHRVETGMVEVEETVTLSHKLTQMVTRKTRRFGLCVCTSDPARTMTG